MTSKDPARWLESGEAPEPLRRLLETGQARLGTPAEIEALAQSLSIALGPSAGLEALTAPPFPDGSGLHRLARVRWLVAVGGITSALALWWWIGRAAPGTEPSHEATVARVAQPPSPVPAADLQLSGRPLSGPEPDAAMVPSASSPTSNSVLPPRRAALQARGTPSEAKLLERARALLRDRPAQALVLTREHRRRFPHGALSEEREVIAIEALERLGKHRAASDEAGAFGARFRDSVHQSHLEQTALPPSTPE